MVTICSHSAAISEQGRTLATLDTHLCTACLSLGHNFPAPRFACFCRKEPAGLIGSGYRLKIPAGLITPSRAVLCVRKL